MLQRNAKLLEIFIKVQDDFQYKRFNAWKINFLTYILFESVREQLFLFMTVAFITGDDSLIK